MSEKMLIDAYHPEETRVVVVRGNRIEEYDFESEQKKQLKGNIYLARVTRVEPSLQAAFVEYGGNRHGFLAFSEIHPDYYQIPVADRLALLEAEAAEAAEEEDLDDPVEASSLISNVEEVSADDDDDDESDSEEEIIESIGADDVAEELPAQPRNLRRQYKIQEVVKKRQILLVQVVKEERGNKGAALTTYLSLAGRYSVLMPNTARGGGISRKITNIQDRKRLKDVVKSLDVPKGMGVILRTAGANRTKAEIKRDYEYLMRLWDNVRDLTLKSTAPCLVYEEGSLIKRSIRDLYNKEISEILVSGDKGYREAKEFMRMLMPRHAKVVQPWRDPFPIFARNGIETQLDKMIQPQVALKSGGYLVINQTEALVAIDVNSGRSTKESSIEETAYQTNLEAAEEITRQLRLRDLAGLVVIDFIDMEDRRNIRAVEKRLKDCLKDDRARIQVGRISHFGLLEMSRQRLRASVLDSTMIPCPHCDSTGFIRSDSSVALHVVRSIEEYLLRNGHFNISVRTPVSIALYVLNNKRQVLADLETRFGLTINIEADNTLGSQHLVILKGTAASGQPVAFIPPVLDDDSEDPEISHEENIIDEESSEISEEQDVNQRRRRRRRRRSDQVENRSMQEESHELVSTKESDEELRRRRRRGRRGGRRNREFNYDRQRLPYAEPVGDFAATALSEVRQARRRWRVPSAEPVGQFAERSQQNPLAIDATPKLPSKQRKKRAAKSAPMDAEPVGSIAGSVSNAPLVDKRGENAEHGAENTIVPSAKIVSDNTRKAKAEKPAAKRRAGEAKFRSAKKAISAVASPDEVATSETLSTFANKETETNKETDQAQSFPSGIVAKLRRARRKTSSENAESTSAASNEPSERSKPARAKRVRKSESSLTNSNQSGGTGNNRNEEIRASEDDTSSVPIAPDDAVQAPKKTGWWQRKGFF